MRVMRVDNHYELVAEGETAVETNRFLGALRLRGLSPCTARAYAFDLLRWHRWLLAMDRPLRDASASDLIAFIADQQRTGAAPRSINRRLMTVRLFYRFFLDRDMDQGTGIRPPPHYKGPGRDHALGLHRLHQRQYRRVKVKVPRTLVEPLTPDQVRSFLRSLSRYRDLAIVYLMLLCGLRSKEVLDLSVDDVVWSNRQLRVSGKGRRERALPLPDLLIRILRDYTRLERPRQPSEARLFLILQGKRRGQPMTIAGLRSLFRHRRRNRTLQTANAHRFRHTFGADMARAGVRLPILQRMLGHADMQTTMLYVELSLVDVAAEYARVIKTIAARYRRGSR